MQSDSIPCDHASIPHLLAYRVNEPLTIDGKLDESAWRAAPRTARFVDLVSGQQTIHDTRATMLWDDANLYVAFWVEEPHVTASHTERDALVYTDNDVEVFIAGNHAYYEFEINAFGTIYEAFFIWDDAWAREGFNRLAEFQRDVPGARPFNGVGFTTHPRGMRTGYFAWDLVGLTSGVHVDGTLNDDTDRDRGWTVELALPWTGLSALLIGDTRTLPPRDGDVWRMSFSRFNTYKEAPPADDSGGWTLSSHSAWDSHIPECFPYVHFTTKPVGE